MAHFAELFGRASGLLSALLGVGAGAALLLAVPAEQRLAAGPAAALPLQAGALAMLPAQPSAISLLRTRTVPVTDVLLNDMPGEMVLAAARRPRRSMPISEPTEEKVPESPWDGTAAPRAPQPAPAPAEAACGKEAAKDTAASKETANGNAPDPAKAPAETPAATPETAVAPVPEEWSAEEIASALKECLRLLGPADAEIEPAEAKRKGPCGSPAPVLLKSVGRIERVEFNPPVEVNCRLAVALSDWASKTLQPAAKELLGTRVARISGASGYTCRNRYGLANAPLSEHALANAVDVPAFVLADGRTVNVASTWGPTARDLKAMREAVAEAESGAKRAGNAQDASAKNAAPEMAEAAKSTAGQPPAKEASGKDAAHVPSTGKEPGKKEGQKGQKVASLKNVPLEKLGAAPPSATDSAGKTASSPVATPGKGPLNNSAPDKAAPGKASPDAMSAEGRFLRRIASGACHTFGTVLGPEANEAHRDHLHLDMKARRKFAYCQ